MTYLAVETIEAAKKHAVTEYPKESCGIVVGDQYLPAINQAKPIEEHVEGDRDCNCQLCSFVVDPNFYIDAEKKGEVRAVLHSHPKGPLFPSQADMEGQVATNVPWGIIALDEENGVYRTGEPLLWGDQLPIQPLIGRLFMHGVSDCYSLVRDTFRLGKDELRAQEISDCWPFDPIVLPEVPRDDGWWEGDQDLYTDGLKLHGFKPIEASEARPGDGFLAKIRSEKYNHAGLLVDDNLIIHHLPNRLSRREPSGIWGRAAALWVRYEGLGAK